MMKNNLTSNKGFAAVSVVGLLLSVFFSLIICYIIFGMLNAPAKPNFGFVCCFVVFDVLVIIALSAFGGLVSEVCGTPAFASCWIALLIYSALQFASTFMFICVDGFFGNQFYILGNLILAFLLLLVTLPILTNGAKHGNGKQ